jgi:tRNA-splicing ligase RtcB
MKLNKVNEFEYEIPAEDGMRVPGKVFASEKLVGDIEEDDSLEQVRSVARLPGILGNSLAMPDIHRGYGFPIGGVAAFDLDEGVISPGGVGYDINCSVRLLKTNLVESDLKGKEKELVHSLFRCVPSGVGSRSSVVGSRESGGLTDEELDEVLRGGAQWAVGKGYGAEEDWKHIEDEGKLVGAVPEAVSMKAKGRGRRQLGTLGAGNHFLDVLIVDEVFDSKVAEVFGLEKGQVVILIHCGSRGLGHQVASDYIREMSAPRSQKSEVRSQDWAEFAKVGLACAPIKSELGKKYFGAMCAAANFAFANKQIITHFVRENLKHYFPEFKADVVYDICHNIAKVEKHVLFGKAEGGRQKAEEREVLVMRKGATRAFGPGREEVPEDYRETGQPVLLPGSMGTPSYVLVGTKEAEAKSWGSCAHGAGRARSRTEAKKMLSFEDAARDMEKRGVFVEFGGQKGMVEEAPSSYKDIEEVVRVCDEALLARKVVGLRPLLVVIG